MIYSNGGGFKDPLKKNRALDFCRNENKAFSILTEAHINHNKIHCKRKNWLGPNFFSLRDSHTKRLLALLHPGLEDITEVDSDPKWRFVSFNATTSNDRVLCVYAHSGHNVREQVARVH